MNLTLKYLFGAIEKYYFFISDGTLPFLFVCLSNTIFEPWYAGKLLDEEYHMAKSAGKGIVVTNNNENNNNNLTL